MWELCILDHHLTLVGRFSMLAEIKKKYKYFRTKFIITPGYFSWNISRPSSTVPFIQEIILGFEISSGTIWRRLSAASSYRRKIWSFRAADSSVKDVLRRRIDSIRVQSPDWLFMKISDHFFQILKFLFSNSLNIHIMFINIIKSILLNSHACELRYCWRF